MIITLQDFNANVNELIRKIYKSANFFFRNVIDLLNKKESQGKTMNIMKISASYLSPYKNQNSSKNICSNYQLQSDIVSFGAKFDPDKRIILSKASDIVTVIKAAFKETGATPMHPFSARSLVLNNPGCFEPDKLLTVTGMRAFNKVNQDLGINHLSTLGEYLEAMKKAIAAGLERDEGKVNRAFWTFI